MLCIPVAAIPRRIDTLSQVSAFSKHKTQYDDLAHTLKTEQDGHHIIRHSQKYRKDWMRGRWSNVVWRRRCDGDAKVVRCVLRVLCMCVLVRAWVRACG